MLIRMTTSIAGEGFDLHPGDETERFSTAEALRFIAADYAVPVAGKNVERAVSIEPAIEVRDVKLEPYNHQRRGRGRPRKVA